MFSGVPSLIPCSMQSAVICLLCGMLPIPNSCSQRTEFGCRTVQHVQLLPSSSSVQEAEACQISYCLPPLSPPSCCCTHCNGCLDIRAISYSLAGQAQLSLFGCAVLWPQSDTHLLTKTVLSFQPCHYRGASKWIRCYYHSKQSGGRKGTASPALFLAEPLEEVSYAARKARQGKACLLLAKPTQGSALHFLCKVALVTISLSLSEF